MSPRSVIERLEDILASAINIQNFTAGMTLQTFLNDPRTVRAVAFEFTTIGESARAIPSEIQERYTSIPWKNMQGIRNVLVHQYFRIDEEILWKASQEDIPSLISSIEKIIAFEK